MKLIIGERYRALLETGLAKYSEEVFWLADNSLFDARLAGHADLSILLVDRTAILSKGVSPILVNYLTNIGLTVIISEKQEGPIYPQDVGLCLLDTGKHLICNPKFADKTALLKLSNRNLISVSQGYTRCSSCVLNEESVITSDAGVAEAAAAHGLDVLKIQPGFINLPGYDYGFIGGAAFRVGKNKLAFTGVLDHHPDYCRIMDFISQKGLEPVFLSKEPLMDIGGTISLP